MVTKLALVVSVAALASCGSPRPATPAHAPPPGDDITLYRDWAVVRQRIAVEVPPNATTVEVKIAAGIAADQVMLLDRGGLPMTALHVQTDPDLPPAVQRLRNQGLPTTVALDVDPNRAGTYSIVIGYLTSRLQWDVAYTMAATPARDRGVLRGALAIRNTTGIVLHAANARLVDAELGAWRGKTAEHLATSLVGGTQASTAAATPRELGALEIGAGETRVDLMPPSTRTMSSVLVFDPIGTKLDNPAASPLRDSRLGIDPPPSSRVAESFEVARDSAAAAGLPAGPVRLLERGTDGSVKVLGESRLFEATSRVANVDTISLGTADRVTGTRERRELTIDDENRRIVEEFVITLDNEREAPASVLVREHLYRGQNWTLAYHSAAAAAKEGAQQIALRAEVPARSKLKILYVVVYTWGQ